MQIDRSDAPSTRGSVEAVVNDMDAARRLQRQQRWSDALERYRAALQLSPDLPEATLGAGICLLRVDAPGEALALFDDFLARNPDHQVALIGKSLALQELGQADAARLLYRRVSLDWPEALAAMDSGPATTKGSDGPASPALNTTPPVSRTVEQPRADIVPNDSAEHCSDTFEGHFAAAIREHRAGRASAAIDHYEHALRIRPNCAEAHLNLGMLWHASGDLAAARDSYETALQHAPKCRAALWNLGLILEHQGDSQAAGELYARVVALDPDYTDAWFRLGYTRMQVSNWAGAADAFSACVSRREGWVEAMCNAALAHWRLGDLKRSRELFKKALAADSVSVAALRGVASLALQSGDYAEAETALERLIDLGDASAETFYNCGLAKQQTAKPAAAVTYYGLALEKRPEYAEALVNLGITYETLGEHGAATDCLRRAVQCDPAIAALHFDSTGE
jgi:tetratricopeptide (TPR) repeat protein